MRRVRLGLLALTVLGAACTDAPAASPVGPQFALSGPLQHATWSTLPDMPAIAGAPAATTDGTRLYVLGGGPPNTLTTLNQIYDVRAGVWTLGASFVGARSFAMAGVLRDGVHLVGGVSQETDHRVYDPASNTWSAAASLPIGVRAAVAEVVHNKLYVIGGVGTTAGVTNAVQIYDPRTGAWTAGTPMPTARLSAASTVIGGDIYVAGGEAAGVTTSAAVERYDARTDTWTVLPALPVARESMGGGALNGRFCVFGGRLANPLPTGLAFPETYCFDPHAGIWQQGPDMLTPRVNMGSVQLHGVIYALGGRAGDANLATAEAFGR